MEEIKKDMSREGGQHGFKYRSSFLLTPVASNDASYIDDRKSIIALCKICLGDGNSYPTLNDSLTNPKTFGFIHITVPNVRQHLFCMLTPYPMFH